MAPPAKAQWSVRAQDTSFVVTGGMFEAIVPLRDNNIVVGRFVVTMSADRDLRVEWQAEPDAAPLRGFEAWSREGSA